MKKSGLKPLSARFMTCRASAEPGNDFLGYHRRTANRQLEGNILAAMCSSPPFHEMGKSFVVTSNLYSTNRMFRCSAAQRDADTLGVIFARYRSSNAQSWSATIRQRDGAPAGILKLKPRQEQKPAPLSNAWQISPAYGRAGAGTGKKPSAY